MGISIISKAIYEKEIAMCKKLNKENDGKCFWGECTKCGVLPCLHKLYKGEVLHGEDLEKFRKEIFR